LKNKHSQKKKNLKNQDLWKNPSYRNMINPYESKYPQPRKKITTKRTKKTKD
jgi:hypothetical protein